MRMMIRDTRHATEWVNDLLNSAINMGVTDLQLRLDRDEKQLTVRARLNRVMEEVATASGDLSYEIVNRIKSHASISTGPAQAIADGLYVHETGYSTHDLRVALFPSVEGEALALRLPASQKMPTIDDVAFSELNRRLLDSLLGMPNGLLLMAGPMGAGKTTTMYAILGELGGTDKNVFTVEDPAERVVPGAVQIQINENARNGWPEVLRGLRRSDLKVLMIGEVRNGEQAQAALEIGNAGAKVVSSIHANDSIGAVHQLLELSKTSPRMVGNQLRGVVSQRLLRVLHKACAGAGCQECDDSGYKGVRPIHEVLVIDDVIVQAMVDGASASALRSVAQGQGMETLWQCALRLIDDGVTDHREAVRVLGLQPATERGPDIEGSPITTDHSPEELDHERTRNASAASPARSDGRDANGHAAPDAASARTIAAGHPPARLLPLPGSAPG